MHDISIFSHFKSFKQLHPGIMKRFAFEYKLQSLIDNRLILFFLSVIAVFVFFPFPVSVTSVGVDEPLSFIFTYLMQGRIGLGKDIIFPHGPLAFIMYPLPGDSLWWIAVVFLIIVRISWAYSFLLLVKGRSVYYTVAVFVGLVLLSGYVALLLTIVQVMVLFLMNYYKTRNLFWFIVPLLLTAFAFFIKAFVAIVCISVVASFFFLELYYIYTKQERIWKALLFLIVPLEIFVIWVLLYGSYHGLLRYILGMQQLAIDNSAATALYPDNLWFWLVTAMISGLILILSNLKNKGIVHLVILTMPALFALWKYSMARQDYLHATNLLVFLFFWLLAFLLLTEKIKKFQLFLSILILFSYYLNLRKSYYYEDFFPTTSGVSKLIGAASNYSYFSDTCKATSMRNIARNKLDSDIRERIGNNTIDVYPWDYSYLAANELQWQPRPVLQSYASYTRWLDNLNVKHFQSASAPEFLLWELEKITNDIHGGTMESIDGRYLLNDEPDLLLALLSNYELVAEQAGPRHVLLYQKRAIKQNFLTREIGSVETTWNTWIDVPDSAAGLLRAQVHLQHSLLGKIKSFLYKDDAVYCFYMLDNGDIRQYRVVPRTMDYGLWINPMVMNPELDVQESKVKKICFMSRNESGMKDKIWVSFNQTQVANKANDTINDSDFPLNFFGISKSVNRNTILRSDFNFTRGGISWSNAVSNQGMQLQGMDKVRLSPDAYSPAFTYKLDSLPTDEQNSQYLVATQLWVKANTRARAAIVLSVENHGEVIAWKPTDIHGFILDENQFNLATAFLQIEDEWISKEGLELKLYVWNNGNEPIEIGNFSVHITCIKRN